MRAMERTSGLPVGSRHPSDPDGSSYAVGRPKMAKPANAPQDRRVDHFFSFPGARADRWRESSRRGAGLGAGAWRPGDGAVAVRRARRLRGVLRLSGPTASGDAAPADRRRAGRGGGGAGAADLRVDPDAVLQGGRGRLAVGGRRRPRRRPTSTRRRWREDRGTGRISRCCWWRRAPRRGART